MDIKELLAVVGIVISIIAPLPYIRDITKGTTKPHVVTWLIWTVLATAGFVIQLVGGGGFGSYVLGMTAFMNVVILCFSIKGSKDTVGKLDVAILVLALLALVIWRIDNNPHVAAIMVTTAGVLGYVPTYRKSIRSPKDETVSLFALSAIKQGIGIMALSAYNLLTVLFPAAVLVANAGLTVLLLARRKQIR